MELTVTAAAGVIRTPVRNRVDNQLPRALVAIQRRRRSPRARGRFTRWRRSRRSQSRRRSHTAATRSHRTTRVGDERHGGQDSRRCGGRPWPRATCDRRDHDGVNQVRRHCRRRCRRDRHGCVRQLSAETIGGCRADRPRHRRHRQSTPENLIFHGGHREPRAGWAAAPTCGIGRDRVATVRLLRRSDDRRGKPTTRRWRSRSRRRLG